MCLIIFAFQTHPRYKLILAANRDEYYHRPTAPAAWWEEARYLLAGKDLEAGQEKFACPLKFKPSPGDPIQI
jgi:uncharacterized protein with NRDE domain